MSFFHPLKMSFTLRSARMVRPLGCRAIQSSGSDKTSFELDINERKGQKLFASVNSFRGETFVNVRQYDKDVETMQYFPSTKGIVLSVAEFEALCDHIDRIRAEVERRVPLPAGKLLLCAVWPFRCF